MKWATGYITENQEEWQRERKEQEKEARKELEEWEKLKRFEKIESLRKKWREKKISKTRLSCFNVKTNCFILKKIDQFGQNEVNKFFRLV